jgi:hypothetical protein
MTPTKTQTNQEGQAWMKTDSNGKKTKKQKKQKKQ